MSKLKPLQDRVVIKPLKKENETKGGIIVPDSAKEKPMEGEVIAVGPGKKDEPTTVKIGDHVLYGKYSGTEVKIEDQDYLIMKESEIFAII